MNQGQTATKHTKDKSETPMVMVHVGQINKTTTIFLPPEEEWRQSTEEDIDIRYIKRILCGP